MKTYKQRYWISVAFVMTLLIFNSMIVFAGGIVSTCDEANLDAALASGGVVTFTCDGVIEITSTKTIRFDTEINAAGQDVTIWGGTFIAPAKVQLFIVERDVTLKLKQISLANGVAASGGAIQNYGNLLVDNTEFIGNSATSKGGAINNAGSIEVFNSSFSGNSAGVGGGAVSTDNGLLIDDSKFEYNASDKGGALHITSRSVIRASYSIKSSRFIDNDADSIGGAIYVELDNTSLSIDRCSFVKNEARAGGAIDLNGVRIATIKDSHFSRNSADLGGAIRNHTNLVVSRSEFQKNIAGGSGGAISNNRTLAITESTFAENRTKRGDGGAISSNGLLEITDSTLEENQITEAGLGGAISVSGSALIIRSTLSKNHANGNIDGDLGGGGALFNSGSLKIINSTLSGNSTKGFGGAIFNTDKVKISSSTIFANSAESGGGIENFGSLVIKNSIVANNQIDSDCGQSDDAEFVALGTNFQTSGGCPGFILVDVSMLNLSPLQDNGGPTLTHAPYPLSIATPSATDCTDINGNQIADDQRSIPRPLANCNVGAVEVPLALPEAIFVLGDVNGDSRITVSDVNSCALLYFSGLNTALASRCDFDENFTLDKLDICALVNHVLEIDPTKFVRGILALPCLHNETTSLQADESARSQFPWELLLLGFVPGLIIFGRAKYGKVVLFSLLIACGVILSSCTFLFAPGTAALIATFSDQFISISVQNIPKGLSSLAILEDGFTFNPDAISIRSVQGAGSFQVLGGIIDNNRGEVRLITNYSAGSITSGPVLTMIINVKPGYNAAQSGIMWSSDRIQISDGSGMLVPPDMIQTYP